MWDVLKSQTFPAILLIAGVFFVFISVFDVQDITKLEITPRSSYIWLLLFFGVFVICISIFLYLLDKQTLGWLKSVAVQESQNFLQAKYKHAKINVVFGQIQDVANKSSNSMVVLPANEYFDDDCIDDTKSALGAYVNSVFPNHKGDIKQSIAEKLKSLKSIVIEKELGVTQASYGIGAGIFLKEPPQSKQPILFVAVTTKRSGEGLRAEMSYIFEVVKKIQQVAADNRIDTVCIPVMGTGHGGLPKTVGLFSLILAICDGLSKPSGHHIVEYNLVVFKEKQGQPPDVSEKDSKRILKTALGLFS